MLGATLTGEVWDNLEGGAATGVRYLDNVDVTAEIDGASAFGVRGLTLFGYALYDNGGAISELSGTSQGTSNIEAPRAFRRYELWADQGFGAHSLRVGFLDLNAEFDAIESAGLYLNPSHGIGPDFAQTGENGPSIFPNAALGARYRGGAGPIVGQIAVFEGAPGDPADPARSSVAWSKDEGFLSVAEVQWVGDRVHKAAIGAWGYDHRVVPSMGGDAVRGDVGVYGFIDARIVGDGSPDGRALYGWVRVGLANAALHEIDHYEGGGLTLRAPIAGRANDAAGVSVASVHFAEGGRETIVEGTARAAFGRWLAVQPDAQLALHPGGDASVDPAFTVGARVELAWSSAP